MRLLETRTTQIYKVLVPVLRINKGSSALPNNWLSASDTAKWIGTQPLTNPVSIRHVGSFIFMKETRDPWRAVEFVGDTIQSLQSRVSLGIPTDNHLEFSNVALIENSRRTYPLDRPGRQVEVQSLSRQGLLYETERLGLDIRLKSALDLLEPLEQGAPGSAVSGGWASIEAILKRADAPPSTAADEMASLVACSFPRAELTTLSYAYEEGNSDAITSQFSTATSNQMRCNILIGAIDGASLAPFAKHSDEAALTRMQNLIIQPSSELSKIREHTAQTFRRLYRQRNLVLHAGVFDSVAMASVLRCAPPLVGAAFDRIVHRALTTGEQSCHDLVARAHLSIRMASSNPTRSVAELLD